MHSLEETVNKEVNDMLQWTLLNTQISHLTKAHENWKTWHVSASKSVRIPHNIRWDTIPLFPPFLLITCTIVVKMKSYFKIQHYMKPITIFFTAYISHYQLQLLVLFNSIQFNSLLTLSNTTHRIKVHLHINQTSK